MFVPAHNNSLPRSIERGPVEAITWTPIRRLTWSFRAQLSAAPLKRGFLRCTLWAWAFRAQLSAAQLKHLIRKGVPGRLACATGALPFGDGMPWWCGGRWSSFRGIGLGLEPRGRLA